MFAKAATFAVTALLVGTATLSMPLEEKMETREYQPLPFFCSLFKRSEVHTIDSDNRAMFQRRTLHGDV